MKEFRRLLLKGIIATPAVAATLLATNRLGELLYPYRRRIFDHYLSPKPDFRHLWPHDEKQLEHFTVSTLLSQQAIFLSESNLKTISKNYSIPLYQMISRSKKV